MATISDMARIRIEDHLNTEHRQLLRRLTLSDETALTGVMVGTIPENGALLDHRTDALVKIAGLVALDAGTSSLQAAVDNAFGAGASDEEILEVVLAAAPVVGSSRISSILPRIHLALELD